MSEDSSALIKSLEHRMFVKYFRVLCASLESLRANFSARRVRKEAQRTQRFSKNKSSTMKSVTILLVTLVASITLFSQEKLYTPGENAEQKIAEAISAAKRDGKYVLIMAGSNNCRWCVTFNNLVTQDHEI